MELDSVGQQAEFQDRNGKDRKCKTERQKPGGARGRMKNYSKAACIALIIFACVHLGNSLKCYHCLERPKSTEKHLSCAYFDMSDKFHKECTHSSFCMKRTSQFQLHNGTYVTIHVHKCADQSHKTMVQDANGDWKWAQLFRRDLYNEGCFPHNTPSMLTTDSYHCFCSTDLCNGASSMAPYRNKFLLSAAALATLLVATIYSNQII